MEPPPPLISWVNPFPSRFINKAIFFRSALESFECACCLLSFLYFHCRALSCVYQRAKPPQGAVLFINLLGKGLTQSKDLYGGWRLHLMDICSFLLVSFHFRDRNVRFLIKFGRRRESSFNKLLFSTRNTPTSRRLSSRQSLRPKGS